MNKTFTTYAEKKAKQILNLLHGYTKGIRMTAILILLLMGVSNVWGKDIYVDMSSAPNWYTDAHIHYWDGSKDHYVALQSTGIDKIYKATINDNYHGWRLCRYVNSSRYDDCDWVSDKTKNKFTYNGSASSIIGLVQGGYIYFDNSTTNWTGNIQFVIGHNSYSRTYEMTQIEHTQLWYVNLTDKENHTWGDATYYGFIASSDKFGDGNWNSSNLSKATKYTAAYTSSYSLDDGASYYCKPSSATNGTSFTITYVNGYNSIPKLNAKQAVKVRESESNAYTTLTGTYPATLKLKGTHLSGYSESARNTISGDESTDSNKYETVVTGLVTHTYENLSSDYEFDGWGTGDEPSTTAASYEYNITAETTVYAFFTKKVTEPSISISTEKTYLRTAYDKLTLKIDYSNIPEGHTYRVHATPEAYFNGNENGDNIDRVSISGNGETTFVSHGYLAQNTYTVEVILWENNSATTIKSNPITIIVEPQLAVQTRARFNNQINTTAAEHPQPEWVHPSQNVGETITASEPKPGYIFAGWEANDNNLIEFDQPNSRTTIVKSKVNGNNSAVAYANYTRVETYAFIQGRFHVTNAERNDQWTNTFDSGDWNEDSKKIKFDYDEVNSQFYLHTYATPKELTNQLSGYNPYFYIKTSTSSSSLTNATPYWSSSKQYITEAGKEHKKELTNSSSNVVNNNLRFNTQDESGYVILYFDQQYIWYELEYTLEYNANEGTGSAPSRTYHLNGSTTTTAANNIFTRDGYAFNGWNTKADGTGTSYAASSAITMSANTTLYAQWTKPTFTVTLNQQDGNGGTTSVEATYGEEMPEATMPQREGFTFGGYFTETNGGGTQYYNANGSSVRSWDFKEPKTLYAKWIQQYVIVGNGNGSWLNGANWIESVIAEANFNVTKQSNNIIDGSVTYSACPAGLKNFRIVPWGTWDILHGKDQLTSCNVPSYTNEDNNIAFVTVAKADITIGFDVANNEITIDVNYDCEGADLETVKSYIVSGDKVMFYYGDEWIANNYPEDSYRYHKYVNKYGTTTHLVTETKGFKTNIGGTDKYLAVAILSAAQYSISNRYDWEGVPTNDIVQAGAIYAWHDNNPITPTLGNAPELADARVQLGTTASGLTATVGNSSVGRAQTITDYYYQLEGDNTWTKFDPNNVSALPVGIYEVHALAHDGNIYVRTAESATLTIYKQYYVQFNANGGEGNMEKQSFVCGETQALSANQFTREGYAFLGWSTTSDGEVVYGDEANVTNLTTTNNATVNLYAQWLSQTPTYTINFDKQNGENGTNSATVQYQNNNYSVNPVVAPTRTDYTFGGYYTEMEGAGVQVVSAAGEWLKSVTGYTDASGNWIKNSNVTTLYAKWISNSTSTEGIPTGVYLVGSFGRWDTQDDKQQFKKATADATIYTLTWMFDAAKTYDFKVSYDGNHWGGEKDDMTITVDNTSLHISQQGKNCKITTTEAGEYIFTWDSETKILSVEYPSDKVSLTFFGDGGTVGAVADNRVLTSPAKVKPGTSVTFTATPDANNAFSQWKKNGVVVSTDLTYTCTIDADATIEAVFLKPTTVFLKPNAQWKSAEARFAIYYWKSEQDNGWVDLEQLTCDDEYYTADVPVGYSQLQFVRMKPNSTNTQNNVWNRTTDLTLPTNGNNLYDLTKIYLKPNANWKLHEARFAAYFFNDSNNEWMSMLNTDEDGVYYCDVPTAHLYNKVNFVRMPKDNSDNNWDINLNESKTIDLYNGSNYYTLEEERWGKNETGGNDDGMDIYYSGKWTKLELPTIIITNTTPDFGDVVVKTTTGRIITNGEKVPFDTKVIVTVTPKNGYKLQTATINGASLSVGTQNTICNNTTINVTFAIKEEWYVIGVDGDWETPQERFRFVDGQLEVELDTNITANFKIAHMQGTSILTRYGNKSFSITERDQTLTPANGSGDHCNIATTYYGKYIFAWDAGLQKLTITYPLSVGDYRLAYQDSEDGSFHPERVIKKCIIGDRLDTVSFFVRHDKQPKLVLQQCATLVDGVGTWQTRDDNIEFSVGSTGVWNFVLQQTNNPTHSVQVLTDDIKPYEGDYYIRTKSAKDGWTYFRSDSHKMTYSSYADNNEPFSHYFCKWVATDAEAANKTKNVRYTIANDYGDCISDTLAADPEDANPRIVTNANGDLPTNSANVRFGWDWGTNEIRRAYLAGSTGNSENTYLRLADGVELKDASNVPQTAIRFNDTENWIYQLDVIATKSTKVNLTALYANNLQYFKGGVDDNDKINLLASDAADMEFNIRLTYDFKTNHLIVAWVPNNNGTYDGALGANMMVIREHDYKNGNGTVAVTQLNLQNDGLTNVDTVYAVMTFTQNWINKPTKTRDQSIYWVSFPFDVKLSDAFGFGEYADAWILQYYDGAERAEKGLFIDSGTYWKYITDVNTTLKAGVGYVLVLDLNKVTFNHGVNSVSLYFPSYQGVNTISKDLAVDVLVPAHQCDIPYGTIDHKITDSNWNLIGVPAFKDITVTDVETTFKQTNANFYYDFKFGNHDGYTVKSAATTFKSMYGYMVQYAGTISWSAHSSIPEQIAARRNGESELPEKVVLGLELVQGEEKADQTFVQLQQEGATTDFDMNLDLTKIINSGANIYTLTNDRIQAAGNALPMEEAIVPVGVQIAAEGEYTFRMPDGTEGMVVELIDYETNTRTNLLLSDYIVTLPKGTSENRFALHIQPQKDVVTSLENIGEGVNNGEAVNKYLIDGKLIIRTAEGIFDAQGKRL